MNPKYPLKQYNVKRVSLNKNFESLVENSGLSPHYKQYLRKIMRYLEIRECRHNTIFRYLFELKHFFIYLQNKGIRVEDVDLAVIEDYMANYKWKKIELFKLAVKHLLDYLHEVTREEKYREIRSSTLLKKRKKKISEYVKTIDFYTSEEIRKLIENAVNFEIKMIIALLEETGARIREILNVRLKDIVFSENYAKILIRESKSESRVVYVIKYAAMLKKYIEVNGIKDKNELLFKRDYNTYLRYLKLSAKRAGIKVPRRPFHAIRHYRATELYKKGLSEKELMLLLGLRSREMIDVYAHIVGSDVEEKLLKIYQIKDEKTEARENTIICPNCGERNPPLSRFCLRCGFILDEEERRKQLERDMQLREDLKKQLIREIVLELGIRDLNELKAVIKSLKKLARNL